MDVNKIKIRQTVTQKEIVVPLDMRWDLLNREDTIISEEKSIIEKVIGVPPNYELVRFSRKPNITELTSQTYEFNFYSGTSQTWVNTYLTRFNENQVTYNSDAFKKSFFKLDLYDSVDPVKQKIYLTLILEARQGMFATPGEIETPVFSKYYFGGIFPGIFSYIKCDGSEVETAVNFNQDIVFCPQLPQVANYTYTIFPGGPEYSASVSIDGTTYPDPNLPPGPSPIIYTFFYGPTGDECECTDNVLTNTQTFKKPKITLDFVGDQEGYFIYWYEDKNLLNIDTLYMKVKFFDGNNGTYTVFTNEPQSNYPGQETTMNNNLFYYQVNLEYPTKNYWFSKVGFNTLLSTLEWYEYVNPPVV